MSIIKREPVIAVGTVVTAVAALIGATNAFGLTTITPEQGDALAKAIISMWPLLLVIRQFVTPAAAPRLAEGTPVRLPDGSTTTVRK